MTEVSAGFTEAERPIVARLFWAAFSAKLGRVMGPEARALDFVERVLDPRFALVARDARGQLLGVAGFKTGQGALVGGGLADLRAVYGGFGALWRGALLALLERDIQPGQLLMDGIFVAKAARGQGVGTRLLAAIAAEAARRGCHSIRLDVIDVNPRARALYERVGFRATGVQSAGALRHIFGFRTATTMLLEVSQTSR